MPARAIPRVLSIAGSDSGGGAGIQADLKAFAACGAHGMSAITAVTAQNTVGVDAVVPVPPEMILAQVRAVASDIGVDAVKVGMLGDEATVRAVAQALAELPESVPVVLDPVMIAESGARLLEAGALTALIAELLLRATAITPNLPEAQALLRAADAPTGAGATTDASAPPPAGASQTDSHEQVAHLARALHALGPGAVLITGGHRSAATDVLFDGTRLITIPGERYPDGAGHGSGCTHSSVLAARLAWGDSLEDAARTARALAGRAVRDGLREIGAGAGPVNVLGIGTISGSTPRLS